MRVLRSALTEPRTATGLEILSLTVNLFSDEPQLWMTSIFFPSLEVIYHDAMTPPFRLEALIVPSARAG